MIWLNGAFTDQTRGVDAADRGFLLGDGVFETILLFDGVPAFLEAHIARLRRTLTALEMRADIDESVGPVMRDLAMRNGLADGAAALRLTVTRGAGPRGLLFPDEADCRPTVLMTVQRFAPPDRPARLAVSAYARSETSLAARFKTTNYLDNVMARNEASAQGCDEAVMLNGKGRVACASAANIFILNGEGVLETPAEAEGALPGIVRGLLLRRGSDVAKAVRERPLAPADLSRGGVMLTSSLIGVRAARLAGAPEDQSSGAMLTRLQSWYQDMLHDDLRKRASAF